MTKVSVTKNSYTVDSLFQWDVNQTLEIAGLSLSVAPEVHFAHDHMEMAIVRQTTMDATGVVRVEVPDRLLQRPNRINAYVCTNENGVFNTLHKIVIPVIPRARPSDYEGENETEVYSLDALTVEIVPLDAQGIAAVEKVLNPDGTWTLRFSIPRGEPGEAGPPGAPVYITDIIESGESGGENVVLFSDGSTLTIKNGKDGGGGPGSGEAGADGKDGGFYMPELTQVDEDTISLGFNYYENSTPIGTIPPMSINLPAGRDGYTPQKGVDYFDGKDGKDGVDGYTPVKGKDYFDGEDGKDGSPGKDGSDGAPGKDGTSVTVANVSESSADGGSNVVTFSDGKTLTVKNGKTGSPGKDGSDGAPGKDGSNGTSVTVSNVSTSSADGGSNVVTFSDGKTLTVKNGSKGSSGSPGSNGVSATHSWSGTTLTVTSASGTSSANLKGDKGDTGRTPVKGTDYWTPADQEAIVQQVITALGTPVFGRVDADNNIILTGELADGTYTLKYEDADGNLTVIGTLVHDADAPTYINKLPLAINADGTSFVGPNGEKGYKTGYRLNSSGVEKEASGMEVTGFIPVKNGDVVYLKNIDWLSTSDNNTITYVWAYDSSFNKLSYAMAGSYLEYTDYVIGGEDNDLIQFTVGSGFFRGVSGVDMSKVAYIRINAISITAESIITVNQPIE